MSSCFKTTGLESFGYQDRPGASYLDDAGDSYLTRYALIMTVTVVIGRSCIEFKLALTIASYHVFTVLNRPQEGSKSFA